MTMDFAFQYGMDDVLHGFERYCSFFITMRSLLGMGMNFQRRGIVFCVNQGTAL